MIWLSLKVLTFQMSWSLVVSCLIFLGFFFLSDMSVTVDTQTRSDTAIKQYFSKKTMNKLNSKILNVNDKIALVRMHFWQARDTMEECPSDSSDYIKQGSQTASTGANSAPRRLHPPAGLWPEANNIMYPSLQISVLVVSHQFDFTVFSVRFNIKTKSKKQIFPELGSSSFGGNEWQSNRLL